jgi:hypothetical protein
MTTPSKPSVPCVCGDPQCLIPFGLCHCGCRQKTTIPKITNNAFNRIIGRPMKFVRNHHRVQPRSEALNVVIEGRPCVLIPLTQDKVAIVDQGDYERLKDLRWFAVATPDCRWGESVFYARATLGGGRYCSLHGVIMNPPKGYDVDHINGDGLDNRRCNLRTCTRAQNGRNRRGSAASGFKGVRWDKHKSAWIAYLHLGSFPTKELAAAAYDKASARMFREFSRPNIKKEIQCVLPISL